jgi:WD40 repeat protein
MDERTLAEHVLQRGSYTVRDKSSIQYANADTGVTFGLDLESGSGQGERAVVLSIETPRSPVFGLEAESEISALAEEFHWQLEGQEADGTTKKPYASDDLIRGYAEANGAGHRTLLEQDVEYHELPSGSLLRTWRWNRQRAALERALDDAIFVPRVAFALHPDTGQVCTAATWPEGIPTLLPWADLLILPDEAGQSTWTPMDDVKDTLEQLGVRSERFAYRLDGHLRTAGLRHVDTTSDADIRRDIVARAHADRARRGQQDESPRIVGVETVLSRELSRLAMDLGERPSQRGQKAPPRGANALRYPRECDAFLETALYRLTGVLGGYTWLSPWRIEAIAIARDAMLVAGVGAGGVVLFDATSGKRVREVRGDVYAGVSAALSADGKTLAVGDELGRLRVFDVDVEGSGPTLALRALQGPPDTMTEGPAPTAYVLGVSADGSRVVGGSADHVFVLRDGEEAETFIVEGAVCVSSDLSSLWTGTELLDLENGRGKHRLDVDPGLVRAPALSPDGRLLAFTTMNGDVQLVRLEDGAVLATVSKKDARGQPVVTRFLGFTPSGTRLVVGDSTTLEIRAAATFELEKSLSTPVWDAALSDTTIYRAVEDRVWLQPFEGPAPPVNDGPVTQLFHSARGPIAASSSAAGTGEALTGGRATLWHLPSGEVLRATERLCPERINLTPDGRLLCLATETALRVFDVGTLKEQSVVEPLGAERFDRPIDLDASPDGEHVLVCLESGLLRMISLRTGADKWRADLGIRCATITPDGARIVGGDASSVRVIDAASGEALSEVTLEDSGSEADHVLLGASLSTARAVPGTGLAIVDLDAGTSHVHAFEEARAVLAASPDGRVVAVATDTDLVLWSVETAGEVDRVRLGTAEDSAASAAFAPDGSRLLVGTARGAVLVFTKQ